MNLNHTVLKVRFFILIFVIIAGSAQAQSFYSSKGIGLVNYFVSGQSVGMGGIGLAYSDNLTVNYLNPAGLVSLPLTFISGNLTHQSIDLKRDTTSAALSNTNVTGFQFVIPIKTNVITMALGLNPYSTIEYSFAREDFLEDEIQYIEVVEGDGGINTGTFSVAFRPFQKLQLGVTGIFYFGNLRQIWRVLFNSDEHVNTQDEVTQSFTAGNVRFGFQYHVLPGWTIGGVFTPSVTLDANNSVTLQGIKKFEDFPDSDLEIPWSLGVGTSVNLGKKFLIGLDYYMQKWSESNLNGFVNDSKRIGAGMEYSAKGDRNSSYFKRMAYRAGFFYRDLGIEAPLGQKVTEMFGTVGLGLPIKWSAARIDLALEAGRRGSTTNNPYQENIIRFSATVTAGEKWFFRGTN